MLTKAQRGKANLAIADLKNELARLKEKRTELKKLSESLMQKYDNKLCGSVIDRSVDVVFNKILALMEEINLLEAIVDGRFDMEKEEGELVARLAKIGKEIANLKAEEKMAKALLKKIVRARFVIMGTEKR